MTYRGDGSTGWVIGFTAFAAMVMLILGLMQVIAGLVAIFNPDFYPLQPQYIFKDVSIWGWVHLIGGVLVFAGGLSLFSGATWARVLALVLALYTAIQAFLFIPHYPGWAIVILALAIGVIWALTTQLGDDV